MPKQTIDGKYEIDPCCDMDKLLDAKLREARAYLEQLLAEIDSIKEETFQRICMFSLLDCLAQEEAGYPRQSKKAFMQFVLKHQKQYDYLECVEPVTLFYHVEDMIDKSPMLPGFPPESEIDLDDIHETTVSEVLAQGKAQKLLDYIEKKDEKEAARKKKDHQLISLLYRARSKAVHELSGLGQPRASSKNNTKTEPYYQRICRAYVQNNCWVSDEVVELVFPNIFVRNILTDCIDGYLAKCKKNKRFPLDNNDMTRFYRLSWYDK